MIWSFFCLLLQKTTPSNANSNKNTTTPTITITKVVGNAEEVDWLAWMDVVIVKTMDCVRSDCEFERSVVECNACVWWVWSLVTRVTVVVLLNGHIFANTASSMEDWIWPFSSLNSETKFAFISIIVWNTSITLFSLSTAKNFRELDLEKLHVDPWHLNTFCSFVLIILTEF